MDPGHETRLELPGDQLAPGAARHALDLSGLPAERADLLQLLVSEVVTNAVRAAPGREVRVRVTNQPTTVHVEVEDRGGGTPVMRSVDGAREGHGGFGLILLDRFAEAWGSRPFDGGTVVWFDLAVEPG